MEKVDWKVEGMDCTNCALSITRYLQKEGQKDVKVNFIGGDVSFDFNGNKTKEELAKGIKGLGYKVIDDGRRNTDDLMQIPVGGQLSVNGCLFPITCNVSFFVCHLHWF